MSRFRIFLIGLGVIYAAVLGYFVFSKGDVFGAGYRPVTGYEARLTSFLDDVTASTTINVNTTKDPAGREIQLSEISPSSTPRVFFTLEPGNPEREEIVMCTGKSTNQWTSCVRGLDFQGGTLMASSTLAHDHNAGSKIIMSNVGQFYGEFLSAYGNETKFGVLTFDSFPAVTNTSALPVSAGQLATKGYVDNVGAGGFTASNVASSSGLYALGTSPETVGINISTTSSGLTFDSTFGYKLKINASSTSLGIDSLGRLYWDRTLSYQTSGIWTFLGGVTSTGGFTVNTPTSTRDVANKGYVDNTITFGTATGTAGSSITAGRALYISSTSTLFQTDSSIATSTFKFVGIALEAGSTGGSIRYSRFGETNCNQDALVPGTDYFINGTAGQVTSTSGVNVARIGKALSLNCLEISSPAYATSGVVNITGTGDTNVFTGFYPTRIVLRAGKTSAGANPALSMGEDDNQSTYLGYDGTNFVSGVSANAFKIQTTVAAGTIGTISAKNTSGFTINTSAFVGNTTLFWTAYSQ